MIRDRKRYAYIFAAVAVESLADGDLTASWPKDIETYVYVAGRGSLRESLRHARAQFRVHRRNRRRA